MAEPDNPSATNKKIHGPWPSVESDVVSPTMRVGAAWSWRFLVIVAGLLVVGFVIATLSQVTIPIAIALLLAALLNPVKDFLVRKGMKAKFASPLVFVTGIVLVLGILTAVVQQFVAGAGDLANRASGGLTKIRDWVHSIGVSDNQINSTVQSAENWIKDNHSTITSGALSTATSAGHVLAGLAIAMFTLFFFLRDGRRIWNWLLGLAPEPARPHLDAAGDRAWMTLGGYVKATVLVAFVDAVGIGIVIAIVGVPLVIPLAALVFLTSFIPLIGATISGIVATLVALVAVGPVGAIIVLAGVIVVQQLEGHLLQPLLMGRAVKMHPLAIVLAIATGGMLIGITGALLAVPIAATLNAAIKQLRGKYDEPIGAQAAIDADAGRDDLTGDPDDGAGTGSAQK
ncbi:putative PurR-regulated permease PerM [Antricoccus suffuscus]|uniref:Putative PurR-regulated permease PerM n=1 Tax=Antricoccus suffuscus TaxID=1629062 RepID=A0A2T1A1V0_9ACTN|nr:AI-2E family transporter [Antricoccus suffuscus]PRZ42563.1 putative PurR-regulated permease PerM [Antricoccus suffuscus]